MIRDGKFQSTMVSTSQTGEFHKVRTALTCPVPPEGSFGFPPHRLAVFLEFEVSVFLPGGGTDLEKISPLQEELDISVSVHT